MVTQNHFVIPATFLEKFRSRGFPEGVTLTADHCNRPSGYSISTFSKLRP